MLYVYTVYILILYMIYALSSHTCAYSFLLTCDCFTVFFLAGGFKSWKTVQQ